jgi:hypothetical protein
MNPIRSNPRGYNIHSPFAYHLVTEVLFNSAGKPTDLKLSDTFPANELQGYLLVVRLLRFFKPARVILAGCQFNQLGNILQRLEFQEIPEISEFNGPCLGNSQEFVIWSDESVLMDFVPDEICGSVWFLAGIKAPRMRKFFHRLKNLDKVSQSYELNRFGFVIFNSDLQKEDYLIRCK